MKAIGAMYRGGYIAPGILGWWCGKSEVGDFLENAAQLLPEALDSGDIHALAG